MGRHRRRRPVLSLVLFTLLVALSATTAVKLLHRPPAPTLAQRYHLTLLRLPTAGLPTTSGPSTGGATAATARAAPPAVLPADGTLLYLRIPSSSAYVPRPAYVYLPPVLSVHPEQRLPVVELLHGVPGGPSDWIDRGNLVAIMAAFARMHGGLAPIVVVPDINGSHTRDSECITSGPGADIESYLASDVPRFVLAHFPVQTGAQAWTIGGLSEGGTCALMLGLRHPDRWHTMIDLSALDRPTLTHHNDPVLTTARLFGGSEVAYTAHDPLHLLATERFPESGLWLECGADETGYRQQIAMLAPRARAAGVAVVTAASPAGGHDWTVWSAALQSALPWLWARSGETS